MVLGGLHLKQVTALYTCNNAKSSRTKPSLQHVAKTRKPKSETLLLDV